MHFKMYSKFARKNLRNASFAQRIPRLRKNVRNPRIARQSTDSYFALRNPRIAQITSSRRTYTHQ